MEPPRGTHSWMFCLPLSNRLGVSEAAPLRNARRAKGKNVKTQNLKLSCEAEADVVEAVARDEEVAIG